MPRVASVVTETTMFRFHISDHFIAVWRTVGVMRFYSISLLVSTDCGVGDGPQPCQCLAPPPPLPPSSISPPIPHRPPSPPSSHGHNSVSADRFDLITPSLLAAFQQRQRDMRPREPMSAPASMTLTATSAASLAPAPVPVPMPVPASAPASATTSMTVPAPTPAPAAPASASGPTPAPLLTEAQLAALLRMAVQRRTAGS